MLQRLKNLVALSKFKPEEKANEVILKKDLDERPRGKAKIVSDNEAIIDNIFDQHD